MTPLVLRKNAISHDVYVMGPLFWLCTIAQKANEVLQEGGGGVALPFIGSLRVQ